MKTFFAAVLTVLSALSFSAQSPSKILKQAEKALGGQNALKSLTSLSRAGTITRVEDGATGHYLYETTQPNLFNESYEIAGFEIESGYNGRSGWTRDSREGLRTLTGAESLAMQTRAVYRSNFWLAAKNEKWKSVSGGTAAIDGRSTNVVVFTTPKGVTLRLFFDAASGLPARDEIRSGDAVNVVDFADYRAVNGVMLPFFSRINVDNKAYEIRFDDVRPNARIARSEFDFPTISNEPLPDIPALLKEVQANEDRVEGLLDKYAYTQKTIDRELGKDGVLREKNSETSQISFYKGFEVERRIEKNGVPLNAKDQESEDKDAAKRVEEIDKMITKRDEKAAKQAADGKRSDSEERMSIAELFRASRLFNPRRERFRGREVVVFDFEPNPNFDMKNAKSILKFFGKVAGVMWIDEKDKQVARVEAVLADSFKVGGGLLAKLNKGASFTMENDRVGDEIWLPSMAEINLSVRVLLVKGINMNQLIRYSDYRRFETEVKDVKVNEKKP